MGRVLFFIIFFAAIGFSCFSWVVSRRRTGLDNEERRELEALRREKAEREGSRAVGEPMVACARCGTYIAKKDALRRGGKCYCSRRCRELDDAGEA